MKILLFGASGLFGINFIYRFSKIHEITAVIHRNDIKIKTIKKQKLNGFDETELIKYLANNKYDVVINAAALTNIEYCEQNPDLAFKVNSKLAKIIANACSINQVKHIFISTDSLHSGDNELDSEKSMLKPLNVYAKSKAEAEDEIINFCPTSLILRTTFYGWGMSKRNSLSDWIISSLRKEQKINCYTNIFFSPLYLFDLYQIIFSLLNINESGTFNISSNERISKYHFAQEIADKFDLNKKLINRAEFHPDINWVKRPLDLSLSNVKLKNTLNININSLEEQLINLKSDEIGIKNYFESIC